MASVTAEEIRDAFLLLNSRVGYTTEGDQRAVEAAIVGWFVDPPLLTAAEPAPGTALAVADRTDIAVPDNRPLSQRNSVGDSM